MTCRTSFKDQCEDLQKVKEGKVFCSERCQNVLLGDEQGAGDSKVTYYAEINGMTQKKPVFELIATQLAASGYPHWTGQVCRKKVNIKAVSEKLNCVLTKADIDRSHQSGKSRPVNADGATCKPRPILVKFCSYRKNGRSHEGEA